jgi:hypothetical protein
MVGIDSKCKNGKLKFREAGFTPFGNRKGHLPTSLGKIIPLVKQ